VKAVLVFAGELVKPGQVLMRIAPGIIIQIQLAQAKVQVAEALLNQDTANGNTKYIAKDQQQLALAQSELTQLQAMANSNQEGNVTSYVAGVVTQVNVNAGQTVSANTPLLTIMDESTVVVHVKVPQSFMGQVHMNQVTTVTTSAISVRSFRGTVTKIIPGTDPKTHTFEVWVSVPNSKQQLLAGMSAEVQFQM
jgi:RND family efflux transporter MFP subunit